MSRPLRIIHVLRGARGGSFRHLRDLARGQAELGHEVGIVTSTGVGGVATDAALEAMGEYCALGVHRLAMERSLGRSDYLATRELKAVLERTRPDVVHGHGAKGAAYARLVARGVGTKAVYTPHGGSLHYSWTTPSGVVYLGLERLLKGRTDGLILASGYARGTYERKLGRVPCPWRVVHNGLHESEFEPVGTASAEHDFVFIGELRTLKGIDVLLDATAALRGSRDLSVLMVGEGPDEARLRRRIDELGLRDTVTVSSPIHPAREAFAKGRCIVIPSLAESLPYIVLEVLASRVPLLATRVGGIPEIVGPYVDELLPAGDADALADAMAAFLDDPGPYNERAVRLHSHLRGHIRVSQMVDATLELYAEVLGSGSTRVRATRRRFEATPGAERTGLR